VNKKKGTTIAHGLGVKRSSSFTGSQRPNLEGGKKPSCLGDLLDLGGKNRIVDGAVEPRCGWKDHLPLWLTNACQRLDVTPKIDVSIQIITNMGRGRGDEKVNDQHENRSAEPGKRDSPQDSHRKPRNWRKTKTTNCENVPTGCTGKKDEKMK